MWEKTRVDGTRRLKCNAVPTLFSFTKPKRTRKSPKTRISVAQIALETKDGIPSDEIASTSTDSVSVPCVHSSDKKIEQLEEKLAMYQKLYKKQMFHLKKYKNALRRKICGSKNQIEQENTKLLYSIFSHDQVNALKRKSTKFMKWSNVTVQKALKLKFSCGSNGYEELLKQQIPLPSLRTLRRRLQHLYFDSGILTEVLEFLKIKVSLFKSEHEWDCVLIMDEMAITPSLNFDTSLNKYFGKVTLPGHEGEATHVLVFMLGGISSRWKQTIAYYFTGNSVNGSIYHNIVVNIIQQVEALGLKIISLTSDMGSSNQALWKVWGISAGRYSQINNSIEHPLDNNRSIYVIADSPHLFKNIKNMLITNKIITISSDIQNKYKLPTNMACSDHINDVIKYQEKLCFKLAPKLHEEDLLPNHFEKMKVGKSTNVISHDVSSALKFLAEETNKPEYLTTAWFIDIIEKWFMLMTSRHPTVALSKFNLQLYNETIIFLEEFLLTVQDLKVGSTMAWKPSQTGAMITTKSILDIQQIFFDDKGYSFLLTSRFTQDCLENLFSVLRSKQVIPNAMQVKNHLKLITVSQYLRDVSKGSYDEDERQFLSGFLDVLPSTSPVKIYNEVVLPEVIPNPALQLNFGELNSLYNVCGYIVNSINKICKTCQNCIYAVGSKKCVNYKFSKLTQVKRYKKDCLFFCNEITFTDFIELEAVFRKYYNIVLDQNIDIQKFLISKINDLNVFSHIPSCHNLENNIIKRYVMFRLKISGKRKHLLSKKYGSKSVFASTIGK